MAHVRQSMPDSGLGLPLFRQQSSEHCKLSPAYSAAASLAGVALRLAGVALRVGSGEVPREEKMLYSGTDPESYITEYAVVYEENHVF